MEDYNFYTVYLAKDLSYEGWFSRRNFYGELRLPNHAEHVLAVL